MPDPFVKLYATILDSSLWWSEDAATRLVWITLLVAADHEGIYRGTIPALAGRARVTLEEARLAVHRLHQPDPDSRTPDNDGRRVETVPGVGFRLLNYSKYREKRTPQQEAEAARKAAYRASGTLRDTPGHVPEVPESIYTLSSGSSESEDPDLVIQVYPRRGRFAPADFEPNEYHRTRMAELRLDPTTTTRDFKLHEFNRPYSDWDRRFSKWIEEQRVRAETERAKAHSGAAKAPGARLHELERFRDVLNPKTQYRRYCARWGLDLESAVEELIGRGVVDVDGADGAKRQLMKLLEKKAREKNR